MRENIVSDLQTFHKLVAAKVIHVPKYENRMTVNRIIHTLSLKFTNKLKIMLSCIKIIIIF